MTNEEGIRRILRRIEPVQDIACKNAEACCKNSKIGEVFDTYSEYYDLVKDLCAILREVDE